jgi:hypothetical protein
VRHVAVGCGCRLYQRVADITEFQILALKVVLQMGTNVSRETTASIFRALGDVCRNMYFRNHNVTLELNI